MRNSRKALALGVSLIAISIAAPSTAQTVPGIGQQTTLVDVNSTLTISEIGDDFEFGVTDSGVPNASATVNSVPTGEISQTASAGRLTLFEESAGNILTFCDALVSDTSVTGSLPVCVSNC